MRGASPCCTAPSSSSRRSPSWARGCSTRGGTRATREDFVRWGYPPWWCRVAGALEIAAAGLIALPAGRGFGLALGALVLAAAAATVLTRRAFGHLAPIGGFAALLLLAAAMA